MLALIVGIIPTWPIVPTKDIPLVSFSVPWKRELSRINPNRYVSSLYRHDHFRLIQMRSSHSGVLLMNLMLHLMIKFLLGWVRPS